MSYAKFQSRCEKSNKESAKDSLLDYEEFLALGRDLTESELDSVVNFSKDEWKEYYLSQNLTKGGVFLGELARKYSIGEYKRNPDVMFGEVPPVGQKRRIWEATSLPMKDLCDKLMAYKAVKSAVDLYGDDELPLPRNTFIYALMKLGVGFAGQANKFIQLYRDHATPGRTFGSCYQPIERMATIAKTPEYWCLPCHTVAGLVHGKFNIPTERIGNIWDFIPAVKAWKVCPSLPKKIAVRIGDMDLWKRHAAAMAWKEVSAFNCRQEKESQFWGSFNSLCQKGKAFIVKSLIDQDKVYQTKQAESILFLPMGSLKGISSVEILRDYFSPQESLQGLFGVSSKSLVKTWEKGVELSTLKWAIELAPSQNIDWINKFLALETTIPFYGECVDFLKSLAPSKAMALIQILDYKSRGVVIPLEDCHYKDTGLMYSNLLKKGYQPELGRVRCWFTTHEELARQAISLLPDEKVTNHPKYQPINGLSAVDKSWVIELPSSTAQLKYWGETLHNCVGGYGDQINGQRTVVFVVKFHQTLKYCVELSPHGDVRQFYGQRNSQPVEDERDAVLSALRDARLVY